MTQTTPSVSQRLAGFVTSQSVTVPDEVCAFTKIHLLDTIGCMVGFARLPWSHDVWSYSLSSEGGPATVASYGSKASIEMGAFVNASFAHGFEMDDTEMRTASHPGVVVVPAALAVAESIGASGQEVIGAIARGYEAMIRVGLGSVGMMKRGFHTTAVTGPFGAAAAAAVLRRSDAVTLAHGFGIAASLASGITEYSATGGSVKRIHAGVAARSGLSAEALARAGVTAPTSALEGKRGLLHAMSDHVEPERVTAALGDRWELLTTGLKPYCCCAGQHTVIDAVVDLQQRHALAAEEVDSITVRQNAREVAVVGSTTEPVDITGAQFSARFGVAMRLLRGGNGFSDYLGVDLRDEALLSLARRVTYTQTAADATLPGDGPAEVAVRLRDGRVLESAVRSARGSVDRPMTIEEVLAKFHDLTDEPLGERRASELADRIMHLERVGDVRSLSALVTARADFRAPSLEIDGASA